MSLKIRDENRELRVKNEIDYNENRSNLAQTRASLTPVIFPD